jgi:hypothetical protein
MLITLGPGTGLHDLFSYLQFITKIVVALHVLVCSGVFLNQSILEKSKSFQSKLNSLSLQSMSSSFKIRTCTQYMIREMKKVLKLIQKSFF